MSRMIQYIKLFFISLLIKGRALWKRIWGSIFPRNAIAEEETTFVSPEKYDSMFLSKEKGKDIRVSEKVWDQIKQTVPEQLVFPNPKSVSVIKAMKADSFNYLFHKPTATSQVYVDLNVWNKVVINLPEEYVLPTPLFGKVTKPMNSEYYDSLFLQTIGSEKVFVDNRVWEQIIKNLPTEYIIPNPRANILIRPSQGNGHIPKLIKHQL